MQRGDYIDPVERRRHFSDWANTWWATTVKLRPTTRRGYWQLLEGHVLPYFGARAMGNIDYMCVEKFIAAKLSEGLSPKKVRDAVSVASPETLRTYDLRHSHASLLIEQGANVCWPSHSEWAIPIPR